MLEMLNSGKKSLAAGALDDSGLAFPAGTPYKGVVPSANFIYGDSLASAVGLTAGTAYNNDAGWLHYIEASGLELYISKKPLRYNVSWEQLNAVGLSNGAAEVTIGGEAYQVKLMSGALDPSGSAGPSNAGGEWNRYMYNIYDHNDRAGFPTDAEYWGDYTNTMLGIATAAATTDIGVGTICRDGNPTSHFTRGSDSAGYGGQQIKGIWYVDLNSPQPWYSWRPMLVKKSTIPATPFKGEVLAANFITGSALATAVGLTGATLINDTTPWLKFIDNGKTFYMPKKITHNALSWTMLNNLGLVTGTKTVVIAGLTYKVRLMTGGDGNDPTGVAGGEYSNYFMRVTTAWPGPGDAWASNSPEDMGWLGGTSSGELIICKEASTSGGHLLRGYPGFAGIWYEPDDSPYPGYGWRPVLEWVPDPPMPADSGPGPSALQYGTTAKGYFGGVMSSELINGTALATACGAVGGTVISANVNADWMKFIRNGKVLFIPFGGFRTSTTWNALNAVGCVYGTKVITIGGRNYKVRLISTANIDPIVAASNVRIDNDAQFAGSEYNDLMNMLTDEWIGYGAAFLSNGWVLCQESVNGNTAYKIGRGHPTYGSKSGFSILNTQAVATEVWRPVLELVP